MTKNIDWTYDEIYAVHAKSIFQRNRALVCKDRNYRPLREIAFRRHVFRCSLLQPDRERKVSDTTFSIKYKAASGRKETVWYEVAKLSMSEALARDEVLHMAYPCEGLRERMG